MARNSKDVTDAELEVLRILWDDGECTVRHIADRLSNERNPVQVPTVQKLLERLEDKDWVARDRSKQPIRFRAQGDRDELIGRRLRGIADQLCEGSITPLLSHLVQTDRLSDDERQQLRDLLKQLDETPE